MSMGDRLASDRAWWAWDHEAIRRALSTALLRHWVPVVDEALRSNAAAGRSPSTWEGLASPRFLRRNGRNVRRVKAGTSAPTFEFLLGVASVLRLSIRMLIPDTQHWIAMAVAELCPEPVSEEEARAYADDRLRWQAERMAGEANGDGAPQAPAWLPSTRAKMVSAVARVLGPVLDEIDRDLRERED